MRRSEAETLALKALGYLASDGDALLRFLTLSGLELADLRAHADNPEILAGIMEFLLADENLCAGFLRSENIDAQELHRALGHAYIVRNLALADDRLVNAAQVDVARHTRNIQIDVQ